MYQNIGKLGLKPITGHNGSILKGISDTSRKQAFFYDDIKQYKVLKFWKIKNRSIIKQNTNIV